MDVILVYGFWKMRKWIVALMGCTIGFLVINNAIRLLQHTQKISSALTALSLVTAMFLFTYFTQKHLNGEMIHKRVLRVFLVALIFSQILFIFFN
jgi:hypothetical protein